MNKKKSKEKKNRFRIDIALIIAFFLLIVSFSAYMINTTLEDVLRDEGQSFVTHDYTFDNSSEK